MADTIKVEILADGTVSFKTDKVSDTNHASADELLNEIQEMLGGEVKIEGVKDKHQHIHHNNKQHVH